MVAEQYLNNRGYKYESVEIRRNRAAYDELVAVSGQTSAPTLLPGSWFSRISVLMSLKIF
jgi:hypothetical protein